MLGAAQQSFTSNVRESSEEAGPTQNVFECGGGGVGGGGLKGKRVR